MIIETDRLIIREFENNLRYQNALVGNMNHKGIADNLSDVKYPYTKQCAREFLKECVRESKEDPRRFYNMAMQLRKEKRVIGCLELAVDEHKQDMAAGISFWQGPGYCGKGYMGEALQSWFKFAFEDLGLRRIEAVADKYNEKSIALLGKIGMRIEGESPQNFVSISNGQLHDAIFLGMLKHEYDAVKDSWPERFAYKPKV